MLDGLMLVVILAAYLGLPYYFLKRGWIVRAGLVMLTVAIVGMGFIVLYGSPFSASALPVLLILLPLSLIFIIVGLIMMALDRACRNSA